MLKEDVTLLIYLFILSESVPSGLCLSRVPVTALEGREASSFQRKLSEVNINRLLSSKFYCLGYIYKKGIIIFYIYRWGPIYMEMIY